MNIRIAAILASLVLAAAPAQAVITSITLSGGTGQIIVNPANVAKATYNGNTTIFGFNEVSNVTLTGPTPNGFRFATQSNGGITSSLPVSSHFFIFAPNANATATGTITFNQNVIAVQRTNGNMTSNGTAQLLTGLTDFTALRDLEATDAITLTGAKTVSFNLAASNGNGDMFRIITAVPETSTWVMLLAGFGMVGFGMRRRRTVVAA